jgi:alkanesulfonate monooxygenase SsuD/methylene tetrahydromethanopterin reductase-like flavin-dependent oxidoreductase (luciferase family)
MEFGAAFWVQRTDWPSLRNAVAAAESAGFDAIWIDDHLLCDEGDWTSPKLEGWSVLAAIAAVSTRPTLGLLVGANTLRNPGLVAKIAATVDEISAGRVILGLGAGWFEREHDAFGFEFGRSTGERLDRLAEAIPLIRRLLDGERVTHEGRFYRMRDALCTPVPRHRVPILVGGSGPRRTLPLVAAHADAWNSYSSPEEYAERSTRLAEACAAVGRRPESIHRSVNLNAVVRASSAAAVAAYEEIRERHRPQPGEDLLDVGGPPETVAGLVTRYRDLGVDQVIWIVRSPWDLETLRALPAVRAALAAS